MVIIKFYVRIYTTKLINNHEYLVQNETKHSSLLPVDIHTPHTRIIHSKFENYHCLK